MQLARVFGANLSVVLSSCRSFLGVLWLTPLLLRGGLAGGEGLVGPTNTSKVYFYLGQRLDLARSCLQTEPCNGLVVGEGTAETRTAGAVLTLALPLLLTWKFHLPKGSLASTFLVENLDFGGLRLSDERSLCAQLR